jgi:predicted Ser/Thr protein kinase
MRNKIEFHDDYLIKTFIGEDAAEKKHIRDNYDRELKAYQRFAELKAGFVPQLLRYDHEKLILEIQRINGLNFEELFNQDDREILGRIDINSIIDQLIYIDAFLYDHRINVLQTSARDLIYDPAQKKVFLTDFEFTIIGSSYKQILYDRLFSNKIARAANVELRDRFWSALRKRKQEFKLYSYRKIKNSLTKQIRLLLPLPEKKLFLESKINVLY